MELGEYPHSPATWIADRYGVTWQLMLTDPEGEPRPFLTPTFMFGGPTRTRPGSHGRLDLAFDDSARGTSSSTATAP